MAMMPICAKLSSKRFWRIRCFFLFIIITITITLLLLILIVLIFIPIHSYSHSYSNLFFVDLFHCSYQVLVGVTTSKTLGFRVCGMRIHQGDEIVKRVKPWGPFLPLLLFYSFLLLSSLLIHPHGKQEQSCQAAKT